MSMDLGQMRCVNCLYLAAKEHRIVKEGFSFKYNDVVDYDGIDFLCDMLKVDISPYDVVLATPPCNWYSRANYRRDESPVALATKHLLPSIVDKLLATDKLFMVENVMNSTLIPKYHDRLYQFTWGQHTFFTNVLLLVPHKSYEVAQHKAQMQYGHRDDNYNVHYIFDLFLDRCKDILSE